MRHWVRPLKTKEIPMRPFFNCHSKKVHWVEDKAHQTLCGLSLVHGHM